MAATAIRDLYETIRQTHTPNTSFVSGNHLRPTSGAQSLSTQYRVAIAVIAILLFAIGAHRAAAQESVIYSFGVPGCVAQPDDAPVFDAKGNIFGTCLGPQPNGGFVYELSPASGGGWTEQIILPFDNIGDNATGDQPNGLTIDSKGNLYGTTSQGGANNTGVVFELSPAAGGVWTETILHNFGVSEGSDGTTPLSGVILDASGNLYGTTSTGGPNFGAGTAYELSPAAGGVWTETFLHTFTYVDAAGSGPTNRLIFDAKGNLYGTTPSSGGSDAGAVFKLAPQGAGVWTTSVLYTFGVTNMTDAINPVGALVFDGSGNLYGASTSGGPNSEGTVFEVSPASGGAWTEKILYSFIDNGTDGVNPVGGVAFDSKGNLYGTCSAGGLYKGIFAGFGYGTIYEIAAAATAPAYKVLYNFDYALNDTDSFHPYSNPVFDSSGNLYGASSGGSDAAGSIYELASSTPTAAAPVFAPPAGTYTTTQDVTITDGTPSSIIYYTTDGSTPTTSSNVYSSAITVASTKTLKAIAVANGYADSPVASATYTIEQPAATPIISPAGGTYASTQSVTITDSTSGATIYYTIDGSAPTTASAGYMGPITVSTSQTISAIAVASGFANSAVASATYTIQTPTAATPIFSPAVGTYTTAQSVTLSDSTPGATIYYTTNGSTPTTASTKYTTAIAVTSTETIKAIAVASGYTNSAVASGTYTITQTAATPVFSVAAGTYKSTQTVTITDTTSGAVIYYTTNGTTPTGSSTKYTAAISVTSTETIEAIAIASGYTNSAVASATYTIQIPTVGTPTFSPAAGTYTSTQNVTISDTTSGATIYYTTNGTTPTTSSTVYAGAIAVSATETIEAIAVATGDTNSAVATATYTITPPAATPAFSPAAGTYTSAQSVTISDATAGATIYYTTDGSTPTTASSKYTAAIAVASTETIKAIAAAAGYSSSTVASATYTINIPIAAAPTFSPAAGTYTAAQSVTIADATAGATIYYTTNGATPTTASTKYTSAITVSATETIEAIAVATGDANSAVATATYTISIPTAATPAFSPAAGTYTTAQSVTIADTTPGATIYYTTDGSTPTASSTKYTTAIAVASTETIEAIAIATGYTDSPVATAVYTINIPTFTVTVSPASLTIAPGQTGTATLTVAPANGFASATTFSCSGLPTGATCSFSPATVTPVGAAPATSTLTVTAPSATSAQNTHPDTQPGSLPGKFPGGATLAIALCFLGYKKRRHFPTLLILATAVIGVMALTGCGGSSKPKAVTTTVTVVATSGAIQQTVPLSITIQ